MALQSSGQIKYSELRTEYAGSGQIKSSDLYRGGSLVRNNASNNPSTNLSANVPTSGVIKASDFYGQQRAFKFTDSTNRENKAASDYFGDDFGVDYPKILQVDSNISNTVVDGSALTFSSALTGSMSVIVNGTITCDSGSCLKNDSGVTISVTGSGTLDANDRDAFNTTFDGNGSAQINFIGGFGGASGPDIYHSDYGGGFHCKLTRSGNTFTASWTYNECDYANLGPGSTDISSIFPLDGNGALDHDDTSEYLINTTAGSNGRDVRDLAFGSKIINGVREIWFASNNKGSQMDLGTSMVYYQPGWQSNSLTAYSPGPPATGNSRRPNIFTLKTGTHTSGSFSVSGVSQT